MTENTIQTHLDHLVSQIGSRFIGSPGNIAAANYIENVFTQSNWIVQRQTFACPSWTTTHTSLKVGAQPTKAITNTYSPSCQITAPIKVVRSLEALQSLNNDPCILVLCGELTSEPIMNLAEHAVYLPEKDRKIGELLRAKKPSAIITISTAPGYRPILLEDPRLHIPSVTTDADAGLEVVKNSGAMATLNIASKTEPSQTCNLIATKTHTSQNKRIILCAHYDTKNGTTGAWDNASGVSALLTIAQHFTTNPIPISLELIAFGAEEYAIEDSFEDPYLSQYGLTLPPYVHGKQTCTHHKPSGLDDVLAVINLDGIGQTLTANTVAVMSGSKALKSLVDQIKTEFPKMLLVGGGPASNHYGFYANGIPSIPIGSLDMKNILHDKNDTLKWIRPERINEVVDFAIKLIHNLSDKSPTWCRKS